MTNTDRCNHPNPTDPRIRCNLHPHPRGRHIHLWTDGRSVSWDRDGSEVRVELAGDRYVKVRPTALRVIETTRPPASPERQCGVCQQFAMRQESACKWRCYACGTIDGGCG